MLPLSRFQLTLLAVLVACWPLVAADPPKDKAESNLPDLSEFRTVDNALTTRVSMATPSSTGSQPGYLGVNFEPNEKGQLVVTQIEPESPAEQAGLKAGDILQTAAGEKIANLGQLGELLRAKAPGEEVKLAVIREKKPVELVAKLAATSRPLSQTGQRATLGIQISEVTEGVKITQLTPESAAGAAGVKTDDILLKVNGTAIPNQERLQSVLSDKSPGDAVTVLLKRDGKEMELSVKLGGASGFDTGRMGWDSRRMTLFRKEVYKLAVIGIEYPDVSHSAKVTPQDWDQALFSRGVYVDKSPTGQPVYGSMNDFYLEQSCGKFRVEGKMFDWVKVKNKRGDYANNSNRYALLTEAMDNLLDRDGKDALKEFDGVFFMYAGDRFQTNRGGLYWPHRATVSHQGKRWAYFICPEGGSRMASISVITHEFGHMLGLPDLYARPENPGSEGLGIWCTMSTGHGQDGKPRHFSAWCKEQLGWLKPAVLDPTVKQKLILSPVENSPKECYKVLIRPDGSEYLLLENRVAKSFDRDIPAEGLLIWRVVDGKPVLEESHGVAGPDGPQRFLASVPYPSKSNNAFTPFTMPSSKSLKGGGLPVHITNIRRLPDGRITFYVGYEYL